MPPCRRHDVEPSAPGRPAAERARPPEAGPGPAPPGQRGVRRGGPFLRRLLQRPLPPALRQGRQRQPQGADGQVGRQFGGRQPQAAVQPAGPGRQQRERGAGDAEVRQPVRPEVHPDPGRKVELPRQGRGGEEDGRLRRLPGHQQRRPDLPVVVRDLGRRAGHVRRVQPDQGRRPALLGVVAVDLRVGQRQPGPAGGAQERLDLGDVHPAQQLRLVDPELLPGVRVGGPHPAVQPPQPGPGGLGLGRGAVDGGGDVGGRPDQPASHVGAVVAVLGHPGHGPGVQRLKVERAQAGDDQDRLLVHLPRDRSRTEQAEVIGVHPTKGATPGPRARSGRDGGVSRRRCGGPGRSGRAPRR